MPFSSSRVVRGGGWGWGGGVIIIIIHLSIAPLHDQCPSQRCITTKQQKMNETAL